MEPKQRRSFTVKEKMSIIARLQYGANNVDISKELNVSHSTISSIWKQRHEIQKCFESKSLKIKKIRKPNHEEIEKALLTWLEAQKKLQKPVCGRDLQEKANQFAKVFGKKSYQCTEGWIFRFRKRYGISVGKVSEEKMSIKEVSQKTTLVSNHSDNDRIFISSEEDFDGQIWNDEMGEQDPVIQAFKNPATMKVSRSEPKAMEFDGKLLIREIKKRPLLYERNANDFSHLADRRQAWVDICATLIKGWEDWNSAEKERAIFLANKRWRNMRNCFHRELNAQKKDEGNTNTGRRKYYYYKDMLFLIGETASEDVQNDTDKDEQSEKSDEDEDTENDADELESRRAEYNRFETTDLIKAVKEEPVLYDKSLENNNGNIQYDRKDGWGRVGKKIFGAKWKQMKSSERAAAVEIIKTRWKHLRSCFARELKLRKKQQNTKFSRKRRREYRHFRALKFLLPCYDLEDLDVESKVKLEDYPDEDESDSADGNDPSMQDDYLQEEYLEIDNDDDSMDSYNEATASSSIKPEPTTSKTIKKEKVEVVMQPTLFHDPLHPQYDGTKEIDQDVNFALSLVPMLRGLSATRKLEIQIEILRLFKNVSN